MSDDEIRRVTEICERGAAGDLEARITRVDTGTDFGRMCIAINHVLDVADAYVREASAAMENCSHDRFHRPILLRGLPGAYRQSAVTINRAGAKMKESHEQMAFVARVAAENASNVATVAAACEELTATNQEIARQTADSSRLTQTAVAETAQVGSAVKALSEAVVRIEGIVSLIKKVAGQTNLLALNATIEAARAGEQGRGFAVVAHEVKELSRSTAKATDEIGQQVAQMQTTANDVIHFVEGITHSIEQVDAAAGAIATSVAEQVKATAEISRSIGDVSKNAALVSERIEAAKDRTNEEHGGGPPSAALRQSVAQS